MHLTSLINYLLLSRYFYIYENVCRYAIIQAMFVDKNKRIGVSSEIVSIDSSSSLP